MKCDACPLKGTDLLCQAETTGHKRFCELVGKGDRHYVEFLKNNPATVTAQTTNPKPVPVTTINVHQIRAALLDETFRSKLPKDLEEDVAKFVRDPNCACHQALFRKVTTVAGKELAEFKTTVAAQAPKGGCGCGGKAKK